jgi:lipoprotein-releasing system ATP-binding protein
MERLDEREPLLRLERVTKAYGGHVVTHALRGIDLEVRAGEFVAFTGPSGSGKSTLLNIIGLLDRATSGHVRFRGVDTGTLDEGATTRLRGSGIGFVFQFHHLLPAFTALENVAMPMLALRGRRDPSMHERASTLLDEVGLADRASYPSGDLSGGQQQRVAVARALVLQPPLVLADEPTGNLDTESGEQVFRLLREINARHHTTFIVVTHDEHLAERCDRIVHLVDGRVSSDTTRGAPPT